jgi:bleomycin hydrolase
MGSAPSKPAPAAPVQHKLAIDLAVDSEKAYSQTLASLSSLRLSSLDGSLSNDALLAWENEASDNPKLQLARTILSHTNLKTALISRSARIADAHVFNHTIDFKTGPITDQKSSGRCWLFATTNIIRYTVMKSLKLDDFQLSQVLTS